VSGKVVKQTVPSLADNHTAYEKRLWDYWMNELLKTERILENNACNLFTLLMSLCDSDTNCHVDKMTLYPDAEAQLDSMKLLTMIKLVYTAGTIYLNKSHNKAMTHMNLMNLHQDRFQHIQDLHEESMHQLGLSFGVCNEHARAVILKEEGVIETSQQQNNKMQTKR